IIRDYLKREVLHNAQEQRGDEGDRGRGRKGEEETGRQVSSAIIAQSPTLLFSRSPPHNLLPHDCRAGELIGKALLFGAERNDKDIQWDENEREDCAGRA